MERSVEISACFLNKMITFWRWRFSSGVAALTSCSSLGPLITSQQGGPRRAQVTLCNDAFVISSKGWHSTLCLSSRARGELKDLHTDLSWANLLNCNLFQSSGYLTVSPKSSPAPFFLLSKNCGSAALHRSNQGFSASPLLACWTESFTVMDKGRTAYTMQAVYQHRWLLPTRCQ